MLTYYQDQIPPQTKMPDCHYLLVSDTYQGKQVGEIIQFWFKKQGLQVFIVQK